MSNELSEERRRLIYRYMQDAGATDAVTRAPERPTLPPPLPDAALRSSVTARESGPDTIFVPPPTAPPWQQRLMHLRYRHSRETGAVGLVALASALGWLVAHMG